MDPRRRTLRVAVPLSALLLAACGSGEERADRNPAAPTSGAQRSSTDGPRDGRTGRPSQQPTGRPTQAPLGTTPPPWLGTRVLPEDEDGFGEVRPTPPALRTRRFTLPDMVPALPGTGYAARITDPAPARVIHRSTWRPGCPVGRDELAWLRLAFRGFDGERHTGELLVNSAAAPDLRRVFRDLWRARFPLERLVVTDRAALDAPPTGDGNGTGSFVCRPVTGGSEFSQHAYGLAVDVNPFQNPYVTGSGDDRLVLPELASAYLDRSRRAPGMIRDGGPIVRAFGRIGWSWGGDYTSLKDWQHFSASGG